MQLSAYTYKKQEEFERDAIPHMNALYNFAVRMTGNTVDASDLVQETYLRAFRFFEKFKSGTNCKAWLYRIMKNTFINQYRKNTKEPNRVDFDDIQDSELVLQGRGDRKEGAQEMEFSVNLDNKIQDFYSTKKGGANAKFDLEENALGNVLDDEVLNALESMPEEFRTVCILCDIENFTYAEIAEFIEKPIGTVRSRLHRGRKFLQKKLCGFARAHGYSTT